MGSGIQVFNANGSLQFDAGSRLLRAVATFKTTASNGSKTVAGLAAAGEPIVGILGQLNGKEPAISVSGNTVSWTFDSSIAGNQAVTVFVVVR